NCLHQIGWANRSSSRLRSSQPWARITKNIRDFLEPPQGKRKHPRSHESTRITEGALPTSQRVLLDESFRHSEFHADRLQLMELNSEFVSIGVIPGTFVCDRAIGQRLQWPLTTQCLETFFAKL